MLVSNLRLWTKGSKSSPSVDLCKCELSPVIARVIFSGGGGGGREELHGITVLEIHFLSVICTFVTMLRKNFDQLFIPIQAIQGSYKVSKSFKKSQKVSKRAYTVYTYSSCTLNQLLYS